MSTTKIHFFGTGAAVNTNVDHTYFYIEDKNGDNLYVDCGGGPNLQQFIMQKKVPYPKNIFITHSHTDHFLGIPHVIRALKKPSTKFFLSQKLNENLITLCKICAMEKRLNERLEEGIINLNTFDDNDTININTDRTLYPLNLYSQKTEQYGFSTTIGEKNILFLGDEAGYYYQNNNKIPNTSCDVLICECFCLYSEAEQQKPYKKGHITTKEAAELINYIQPKKVFITHIQENTSKDRNSHLKEIYTDILRNINNQNIEIVVPLDGEEFSI